MTNELVARIANAIEKSSSPESAARAALTIMRKPTKSVLRAGQEALGRAWKNAEECWVAMIDEALK